MNFNAGQFHDQVEGRHFPQDVILFAVFFCLRYPVSYHDLKEIMQKRGVDVDHATLNRWVIDYSPLVAEEAQKRKASTSRSRRVDKTYPKVEGRWMYHDCPADKFGQTLPVRRFWSTHLIAVDGATLKSFAADRRDIPPSTADPLKEVSAFRLASSTSPYHESDYHRI